MNMTSSSQTAANSPRLGQHEHAAQRSLRRASRSQSTLAIPSCKQPVVMKVAQPCAHLGQLPGSGTY